jgi:NADPH-dependent 2,4-dienoyl-CoA reductase/sulfur reductase-like enzyme
MIVMVVVIALVCTLIYVAAICKPFRQIIRIHSLIILFMHSHSCIIAGAGLIGLEMVEAFKKRGSTVRGGMDVTLVEMADHVLPTMLGKDC